jgi:hypothetical protein
MKKFKLVLAFFFVNHALIFAQEQADKFRNNSWEFSVNEGLSNYAGSTVVFGSSVGYHFNRFNNDLNIGYGVLIRKNFTSFFAFEGAYNSSTLTGSPKSGYIQNNSYRTDIHEFDLNTVWNMNNLFSHRKFDRKIYWFVKVGIGLTLVHSIEFTPPLTILDPWRGTLPLGTGLAIRLWPSLKLDIGTQFSTINTNELDGLISSDFYSPGYLSGQIREHILYTYAGFTYVFGK